MHFANLLYVLKKIANWASNKVFIQNKSTYIVILKNVKNEKKMKNITLKRCEWVNQDPLYIKYHDEEWGKPVKEDTIWFEFLILEGAQAGLNWLTILKRRENYRQAFSNFDPNLVAIFDEEIQQKLLLNEGLIRNRLKIKSAINNAKLFLEIQQEFGSFNAYIWQFTGNKILKNTWGYMTNVPAFSPESTAMSKALKKRGFTFVGPTICYALMQATGMVNDHTKDCFCY